MSNEPVSATIRTKFDLGYIVELEGGEVAQLRVLEQKGFILEHHVAGTEDAVYGETIFVYVTHRDEQLCVVSQFSPTERLERAEVEAKEKIALNECEVGATYTVMVEKELEWGYLCKEVGGFLAGAVKKPVSQLNVGEEVQVVVVGKNRLGNPFFGVTRGIRNA